MGISFSEQIVLEAMWLKHDADLQRLISTTG
jgi:hypothetical protein